MNRYLRHSTGAGVTGNQLVIRTDRPALAPQLGANLAVVRSGQLIVIQYLQPHHEAFVCLMT